MENSRLSDKEIEQVSDPFNAECRAYNKIASSKPRKKPIAVACYGYITISSEDEAQLAQKFRVGDWNRTEEEYMLSPAKRTPLRALVKELVISDPELTDPVIKSMIRELKALNSLGIYVRDISIHNYKGGHVVDFSSSFTRPHFNLRRTIRPAWRITQFTEGDLHQFDEMIEALGIRTSVKAITPTRGSQRGASIKS
jgi:kinetochore complex Sim4 subunit Fta2